MDPRETATIMAILAAAYGRKVDEPQVEVYHRGLKDLPFSVVKAAVADLICSDEYFPPIARIRHEVEGDPDTAWHRAEMSRYDNTPELPAPRPDQREVNARGLDRCYEALRRVTGELRPRPELAGQVLARSDMGRYSTKGRWVGQWQVKDPNWSEVWGSTFPDVEEALAAERGGPPLDDRFDLTPEQVRLADEWWRGLDRRVKRRMRARAKQRDKERGRGAYAGAP